MMLPPFQVEEASKFLIAMTGRTDEPDEHDSGDAIAQTLGGIPLAISQMAGVIARRDLSFGDFLEQYEAERTRADLFKLQIGHQQADGGNNHTIASVWALDSLAKGWPLLEVLALLDADGIPEYILSDNKGSYLLTTYPQNDEEYEEARTELQQSSLISRERNTKKIVIHRLIQDAARAKMSDDRFDEIFSFTFGLVSAAWPYEEFGFGNELYRFARCGELYPHVLWLRKLSPRFRPPTKLTAASLELPKVILDAAWFKIMSGDNYQEVTPLLELARSFCDALWKGEKGTTIEDKLLTELLETFLRLFHHHYGVVSLHTNNPEQSLDHFKAFTEMLREKIGGDKPSGGNDQSLGVAWNELGNAYLQNGLFTEAEDAFNKSMEALKCLTGATEISINMPLINQAFCYWLQGRLEDADLTFAEALDAREVEYGVDDTVSFVTGKLLLGYGHVKAALGDLDESFSLHQRCLMQYKATTGNNHHRTGDACIAVSNHYVRHLQYAAALGLLDQALKIYGDQPHFVPERARANYKRGKVLELLSRPTDAKACFRKAELLYRKMCPRDRRKITQLQDEDFDQRITFWSR